MSLKESLKVGIRTRGHATEASLMLLLYAFHKHNKHHKLTDRLRTSKAIDTGPRNLRIPASKRISYLSEDLVWSVMHTFRVRRR